MRAEKTDIITLKIPHSLTKKVDKYAILQDRSRSSFIRIAMQKLVEELAEEAWAQKVITEYKKDKSEPISFDEMLKRLNITKKDLENFKDDFKDCD